MKEIQDVVKSLTDKYGNKRESLLPILQGIAEEHNYLSSEAMLEIARALDISAAEVFGTASFYSFLDTVPRGKYVIRVCRTIVCDMHGKKQIVKTLEDLLKIKVGETTHNGKFTLLETNCLGWCHKGPCILVNDDIYTEITPAMVNEIINKYRNK